MMSKNNFGCVKSEILKQAIGFICESKKDEKNFFLQFCGEYWQQKINITE